MLTLRVIVMGDVVVPVHIVVGEGDLIADERLSGIDRNIQLIHNRFHRVRIQQIQLCLIIVQRLTSHFSKALQRVVESAAVKGLMVGVNAGIDDGDTAAGAGIAGLPGNGRTDLLAGGSHVGIVGLVGVNHHGLIPGLNQDLFDTGNLLNGGDLTILHVRGDDVRGQRQVPHNVQLLTDGTGDLGRHTGLRLLQLRTVSSGSGTGGNIFRRAYLFNRGLVLKHDGNTNGFRIGIRRRVLCFFDLLLFNRGHGNSVVVDFLKCDLVAAGRSGRARRNRKSRAQRNNKHQRKQTLQHMLLHTFSPFIFSKRKQWVTFDLDTQIPILSAIWQAGKRTRPLATGFFTDANT